MAAKAKKSSSAKKHAAETAKPRKTAVGDAKTLNKEIGEALFTDEERIELFFANHWKKLVAAALIAVVAITGVFAFFRHREASVKATTAKLAQAKTVAEIEAELARKPDTPGVDAARFRLAKLYENDKKYDQARQTLEPIVASSDAIASNRAKLNAAYLFEIEGKLDEATKRFNVLFQNPGLPVEIRAEAAYAAARLQLKAKNTAAVKETLGKLRALNINPQEQPGAAEWLTHAAALESSIK